MSGIYELTAINRDDTGKGASRRLRRGADLVPGIIYGGDKTPQPVSLSHKDLSRALENEAFFSHLITLKLDGGAEEVIIKALQRHPSKPKILHADFQRVSNDRKISMHIPLHFTHQEKCHGVKNQGGLIQHNANEVYITCLPRDLPEFIEVDMTNYEIGQAVHISDLKLPEGVESVALLQGPEHDLPVATVLSPKVASADEATEAAPAAATPTTPTP